MSAFLRFLCALALVSSALLLAAARALGAPRAASPTIECQHPLVTGEEAFHLVNVSKATACGLVVDLGHWEAVHGNLPRLYKCVGPGKHTPVLKLTTFNGWKLSLSKDGYFKMSLKAASFEVIGTDFPLNCT